VPVDTGDSNMAEEANDGGENENRSEGSDKDLKVKKSRRSRIADATVLRCRGI
jgi:hypothetical protein